MQTPKPTPGQLDFLNWEYGMFFHFGIRSFYPGHRDWDGIEMPPEKFDPASLDCDQWLDLAVRAGARYAILTTKHHDGFALWPSRFTSYSVAATPWKGGKGDVVREFTEACRRHGVKVGLYYSPAQWGGTAVKFENGKSYDDYFINQITELLTGYGKIDYLWFDACGSEGHEYDRARIVSEIYRLQPDVLTFCDPEWSPDVHWAGNEDGMIGLDNTSVISRTDLRNGTDPDRYRDLFTPAECDCRIRNTWFYDLNEASIKSADELFGMYELSVGRGANFLLNVSPDDRGLIPDADARRLLELKERIDQYSHPADYGDMERDGNRFFITHPAFAVHGAEPTVPVNRLAVTADLTEGTTVRAFRVYAHCPRYHKVRILLYEGRTVGRKTICAFPAIRASRLELEVTEGDGSSIRAMRAFAVK